MNEAGTTRIVVLGFFALFFAYLFGPLIIMAVSAFNSANFPRVTPWDCFSVEWFGVLFNDAMPLMAAHMIVAAYVVGGFLVTDRMLEMFKKRSVVKK